MMKPSLLLALSALVLPSHATFLREVSTNNDGQRNLIEGDLTAWVVQTVNGVLSGQLGTINSAISGAVQDPFPINPALTGMANGPNLQAPCTTSVATTFTFTAAEMNGLGGFQAQDLTLELFERLTLSLCGDIQLADTSVQMITTNTALTIPGTVTVASNDVAIPACTQSNSYAFNVAIANNNATAFAVVAGGKTAAESGFTVDKFNITSLTVNVGAATTTSPDLVADPLFGALATQILSEMDTEINTLLQNDLKSQLETELLNLLQNASDSITMPLKSDDSPEMKFQGPSRLQIARQYICSVIGC